MVEEHEYRLTKFLHGEASSEDLDFLSAWILDLENEKIFNQFVKIHLDLTLAMSEPNIEKIKDKFLRELKLRESKARRRRTYGVLKYAAMVIFLLGFGYYLGRERFESQANKSNVLIPKKEDVTIQFEDGIIRTLYPDGNMMIKNSNNEILASQNGSRVVYKSSTEEDILSYHTINIPYGKRFDVVLSDGTHVYLNSGSSLRYPVNFLKGSDREVFLTGEGYFDVAHDPKVPFRVLLNKLQIEVLGTEFNVSQYPESDHISTVLVEGTVKLKTEKGKHFKSVVLDPGFKGELQIDSGDISVESVDTRLFTSWMEGKLLFRNTTFKDIRHALERRYNVTIVNNNAQVDQIRFDATFDIESIEEVLQSFNKSYAIDYTIKDNKIIIN